MQKNAYQTEIDYLALGLTRSPMFMGINMRLFFFNLVFCAVFCIDAQTFLGIPFFFLLHLIFFKQSIKEPNFFSIWLKAMTKTPPSLNYVYWGKTNSYEPW